MLGRQPHTETRHAARWSTLKIAAAIVGALALVTIAWLARRLGRGRNADRRLVVNMSALLRCVLFLLALCIGAGVSAAEYLHPEVAFKPSVAALDGETIELRYEIAKGYYLYRDNFRVSSTAKHDARQALTPTGKEKEREFRPRRSLLQEAVASACRSSATVPAGCRSCSTSPRRAAPTAASATRRRRRRSVVELPDPTTRAVVAADPGRRAQRDERDASRRRSNDASLWAYLAFFFVAGLRLSLTPCVLPMIPSSPESSSGSGQQSDARRPRFRDIASPTCSGWR